METVMGQIYAFAFNFTPKGFLPCNGQLLPIATNSALYTLLGTTYGGDGQTTFALPDLRGRTLISQGQGQGLRNYTFGQRAGKEEVALMPSQLPAHSHTASLRASESAGEQSSPIGKALGGAAIYTAETPTESLAAGSVSVGSTGDNLAHENMPPYLAINYCIAVMGIYPQYS
jgi:microcystin-dependent protein